MILLLFLEALTPSPVVSKDKIRLLKAVDEKYLNTKKGILIFEANMSCGFGICCACTIYRKNGIFQKICLNSAFPLGSIDYKNTYND